MRSFQLRFSISPSYTELLGSLTRLSKREHPEGPWLLNNHDTAGNIINDGNHTYTYDAEERMIAVDGGSTATYSYDAMGRRFATNVGGTQQEFLFDLNNRVLAMQNAATHSWDRGEI